MKYTPSRAAHVTHSVRYTQALPTTGLFRWFRCGDCAADNILGGTYELCHGAEVRCCVSSVGDCRKHYPRGRACRLGDEWHSSSDFANGGWGASPFAPLNTGTGVTSVLGLTRGSGVGTSGTGAARGWGGTNWSGASLDAAVSGNQFFTFGFTVGGGYTVSLTSLNEPAYRHSGTGPTSGEFQYSINGGSFTNIIALSYPSTSSSGAALSQSPVDLSSISDLQNIPTGTVVTFRQVNWGGASAGSWYLYDQTSTANSVDDLSILGTAFSGTPASVAIWNPGASAHWNTSETNWLKNSTAATFATGDIVHFDDGGVALQGGNVVVDAGGVLPNSTVVSNTGGTYTFSGGSIGGSGSLTKSGGGTLILSANNSYSGGTNVTGGMLEFTADSQLGSTSGSLSISNATLKSDLTVNGSNLLLDSARAVTATNATIDIAPNTMLTIQGNATFGGTLTLSNSGTLALTGGTRNLGSVAFSTPSTLKIGASPTDAASISGDITVNDTTATTTIDGSLNFSGGHTITVAGGGKLVITGGISDTTFLTIAGSGTIDAQGDNSAIPNAIDMNPDAFVGVPGPTLIVHNPNSLGTNTNTSSSFMHYNAGTIRAVPDAPATSITFTTIKLSISTVAAAPAIFDGADMEFAAPVRLHPSASGPDVIQVNNHTTFSGGWAATSGSGVAGLVVTGPGSLTLSNTAGGDLSLLNVPLTADTATLNVNAQATNAGITSITAQNSGTIKLGASNDLASTANVVLAGGGTLNTGGNTQSLGNLSVTDMGTLDLGAATSSTSVNFADSSGNFWGTLLTIKDWKFGIDHLYIGADANGLTASQLSQIKFTDFAPGASITTTASGGEVTPLIGDINQDGAISSADVTALMTALSNENAYQSLHTFTAGDLAFILDVNHNGIIDNADLQTEISLVANAPAGGGRGQYSSRAEWLALSNAWCRDEWLSVGDRAASLP